jgi:hypothetical protein
MVWFHVFVAHTVKKVTEESFAVGDIAKKDFVLVELAGKRSISHYMAEVVNGYEYEIGYYKQLEDTNKFILAK